MARCRDCENEVIWVSTESGKSMPLDAKPDDRGKWVLIKGVTRRAIDVDGRLHRLFYTCHFDTCSERERR
jgi:hypothetical protein